MCFTHSFWALTVQGLSDGFLYALIALGYTLVYGVLQLINFAHSEVFMSGGFAGYFVLRTLIGSSSPHGASSVGLVVVGIAAGAAAEFFFPDKIPFLHRSGKVGVPIGVPDASKFATTPTQATNAAAPVTPNQPIHNASPAIAKANEASPPVAEQDQSSNASGANSITNPTQVWNQIASAAKASLKSGRALLTPKAAPWACPINGST